MTAPEPDAWAEWVGVEVVDRHGEVVGVARQFYADRTTGRPTWIAMAPGPDDGRSVVVPIDGVGDVDGRLRLPLERTLVAGAPALDLSERFSGEDERSLVAHYRRGPADEAAGDVEVEETSGEDREVVAEVRELRTEVGHEAADRPEEP